MNVFLGALLVLSLLPSSFASKRGRSQGEDDEENFLSSPKRPRRTVAEEAVERSSTMPVIEDITGEFCFEEPENFADLTINHFIGRAGDDFNLYLAIYESDFAKLVTLIKYVGTFSECRYASDKGRLWNLLEFAVAFGSYDACMFFVNSTATDEVDAMKPAAMELAYLSNNEKIRALFGVKLPIPKKQDDDDFNFGFEHEFGNIRKFLKSVDWSISAQNEQGVTALMFALDFKCSVAVLEILIQAGFSAEGQDECGETVFHKLVVWHSKQTAQKDLKLANHDERLVLPLIKLCPHLVDVPDNLGNTPLHYAIQNRRLSDLCKIFIKAGANGEHTNLNGKWAVQMAPNVSCAISAREHMEPVQSVKQMIAIFAGLFDDNSILFYVPREILLHMIFPIFVQLQNSKLPASTRDTYVLLRLREFPQSVAGLIMQHVSSKTARKQILRSPDFNNLPDYF